MNIDDFLKMIYPEPNTGCWIWAGRQDEKGYGRGEFIQNIQLAHRFAYRIFVGPFDLKKHVLHICDNPHCVNPQHLYLGDQAQNNLDRDNRGRQRTKRGTDHALAKLDDDKVRQIRVMHDPVLCPSRKLAKIFGVSQRKILDVINYKSWVHVK